LPNAPDRISVSLFVPPNTATTCKAKKKGKTGPQTSRVPGHLRKKKHVWRGELQIKKRPKRYVDMWEGLSSKGNKGRRRKEVKGRY